MNLWTSEKILTHQPKKESTQCQNIPFFNQPNVPASSAMYNFLPSWHLHGKGFGWLKSWNTVNFSWGVLLTLRFDPAKPAKRQDKKDLWILRSYLGILYDCPSWSHFHLFGHVHLASWKMNENDDSIFKESIFCSIGFGSNNHWVIQLKCKKNTIYTYSSLKWFFLAPGGDFANMNPLRLDETAATMDQEKVGQRAKVVSDLDIQNSLLGETAILQIDWSL